MSYDAEFAEAVDAIFDEFGNTVIYGRGLNTPVNITANILPQDQTIETDEAITFERDLRQVAVKVADLPFGLPEDDDTITIDGVEYEVRNVEPFGRFIYSDNLNNVINIFLKEN